MKRAAFRDGYEGDFSSPALNRAKSLEGVDHSARIEHVISQLRGLSSQKRMGPKFSFVLCPYHNERTPSGRVQHDSLKPHLAGFFKCYGCNRTENWNTLASDLGMEPFDNVVDPTREMFVPVGNLEEIDKKLLGSDSEVEEDLTSFPITNSSIRKVGMVRSKGWRGFDFDFLVEHGASFCYSERAFRHYVYLSVTVNGKEKGFIRAQLEKPKDKKFPSYLNAPGPWSLDYGLYPFDSVVQMMQRLGLKTIFLVEGPRDALRLIRMGVPAMALLGTHSWSDNKLRILQLTGAERIVLMFDGDEAGKKCTQLVKSGKKKLSDGTSVKVSDPMADHFTVKVVRLWNIEEDPNEIVSDSKFDAGNLPDEMMNSITSKLCV